MSLETGRWTESEHQRFLQGLNLFGRKWTKVAEVVGTRSTSQVRSHAQKYFAKLGKVRNQGGGGCGAGDGSGGEEGHSGGGGGSDGEHSHGHHRGHGRHSNGHHGGRNGHHHHHDGGGDHRHHGGGRRGHGGGHHRGGGGSGGSRGHSHNTGAGVSNVSSSLGSRSTAIPPTLRPFMREPHAESGSGAELAAGLFEFLSPQTIPSGAHDEQNSVPSWCVAAAGAGAATSERENTPRRRRDRPHDRRPTAAADRTETRAQKPRSQRASTQCSKPTMSADMVNHITVPVTSEQQPRDTASHPP